MDILIMFQISLSILSAHYFIQLEKLLRQWVKDYLNKLKSDKILKKAFKQIRLK